jgi:hypothetical protein
MWWMRAAVFLKTRSFHLIKMEPIDIRYRFKLDKNHDEIIDLRLDALSLELVNKAGSDLPSWTKLDFHQCPHCPLDRLIHPDCPVAASLVDVVRRFDNVMSYDKIDLEVTTMDRRVSRHTTAQKAISSLVGMLFPASGCPHTAFFKPMVRFHLPLASEEATIFRATGMYLLAQYFLCKEGQKGDFELKGLKQIYNNMHLLNVHIAERLSRATRTDSSLNAIIILDVFTHALPYVIEDHLEEIRHLFAPYLSDFYNRIMKDVNSMEGSE